MLTWGEEIAFQADSLPRLQSQIQAWSTRAQAMPWLFSTFVCSIPSQHSCQLYSARLPMGPSYQFLSFCLCPLFLSGMDFHYGLGDSLTIASGGDVASGGEWALSLGCCFEEVSVVSDPLADTSSSGCWGGEGRGGRRRRWPVCPLLVPACLLLSPSSGQHT